ncbi:radical SAM protein [Fusobacterium sp. PH5-44]|uniref:radical SAM protein n=1 Tax=unclassified Fusobacterium TaxID=2648384 RepID=UPI003D1C4A29
MERKKEVLNHFNKRLKSHHDAKGLAGKYFKSQPTTKEEYMKILNEKPSDIPKAIYVHTPYCDKICSFCNLNRKQIDGSLDEYAQYLADQFEHYGNTTYFKESEFQVIFFGGGTPTVFNDSQLKIILESIQKNVRLKSGYEFTFESTLHNLSPNKAKLLAQYGVNRFSIGIQTFDDAGRKFYNRTYSKAEVIDRLKILKDIFTGDLCIDLIYNYPKQTIEQVKEDVKIIKALGLSSASFYSLMVHEGSKLSHDINSENVQLDYDIETDYNLHDTFLNEVLKDSEYHILELTKVAKNNADNYQYIKVRNNGGDTFPIGIGAGGNIGNIGIYNMNKTISFFVKHNEIAKRLSKLSGLLQFPVISSQEIKTILTPEEFHYFNEKIKIYINKGLIQEMDNNYILTYDGIFWGNNISSELLVYILDSITQGQRLNN